MIQKLWKKWGWKILKQQHKINFLPIVKNCSCVVDTDCSSEMLVLSIWERKYNKCTIGILMCTCANDILSKINL